MGQFAVDFVEEARELFFEFGRAERSRGHAAVANIVQLAAEIISLRTKLTATALYVSRNHAQA